MPEIAAYSFDRFGLERRRSRARVGAWTELAQLTLAVEFVSYGGRYVVRLSFLDGRDVAFVVPVDFLGRPRLDLLVPLLTHAAAAAPREVNISPRVLQVIEWGFRDELQGAQLSAVRADNVELSRLLDAANWRWARLEYRKAIRLATAATRRFASDVGPWKLLLMVEAERGASAARVAALGREVLARDAVDPEARSIVQTVSQRAALVKRWGALPWVATIVWLIAMSASIGWRIYQNAARDRKNIEHARRLADAVRGPEEALRTLAEAGDVEAMILLAGHYDIGLGFFERDPRKAYEWRLRAAEAGHVPGMLAVGRALLSGRGVEKDVGEAQRWLTKAAEADSGPAAAALGDLFFKGGDVARDCDASFQWLQRAIALGHKPARRPLAHHYENGFGTARDPGAAYSIYRELADEGNRWAANKVGVMFARGEGVERDLVEAVRWYRISAEKGYATAQTNLAFALGTGRGTTRDEVEAAQWLEKAAAQKHPSALRMLGQSLLSGRGLPRDDERGVELIRQAADLKETPARLLFAELLWRGRGMEADRAEARRRIEQLVSEGYAPARSRLAQFMLQGGEANEFAEARTLFQRGAEQGSPSDRTRFAVMCLEGIGGPQDVETAKGELKKASDAGESMAALFLACAAMSNPPSGEAPNLDEARRLLRLAVERKNTVAAGMLSRLEAGADVDVILRGEGRRAPHPMRGLSMEAMPLEEAALPDERMPIPVYQARPTYPISLRFLGCVGEVVVDFVISERGDVLNARAIRSTLPAFEEAAVAAVELWRFKPGVKRGRYVKTHMQVPIVFHLNEAEPEPTKGTGSLPR